MLLLNVYEKKEDAAFVIRILGFVCILFLIPFSSFSQDESSPFNCFTSYQANGFCPDEACLLQCSPSIGQDGCVFECVPRPCEELSQEACDRQRCDLVFGCANEKVCFPRQETKMDRCGGLAYAGDDAPCCPGLVKRCGMAFFDGTCDMIGARSMYSVPICLPCGNGICNQFENICNCPEDCRQAEWEEDLRLDEG